jgi:hypothetical protein
MKLQQQLDEIRAGFKASAPAEAQEIMSRAAKDLAASGVAERTIKKGDKLPEFTLNDSGGNPVSSATLLAAGPLVISFYRGVW